MKFGYLRQDESGHWYVVPEDKIASFDAKINFIHCLDEDSDQWYNEIDVFEDMFSTYRTGGGYTEHKVVMEEDESQISVWYASNKDIINSPSVDGITFVGIETESGTEFIPTEAEHKDKRIEDFKFARKIL